MKEPPQSWVSGVGNSMDCFRESIVRERVILLRRKDFGNSFEDVIASTFETTNGKTPELVIKQNLNETLEAARQRLLALPVDTYALAKLRLDAKYHDKTSNFWTCYMTSDFCQIPSPYLCIQAYRRKTHRDVVAEPPVLQPTPTSQLAAQPTAQPTAFAQTLAQPLAQAVVRYHDDGLATELEAERAARKAQDKRIAELESKVLALSERLNSMRVAFEIFRLESVDNSAKKRRT